MSFCALQTHIAMKKRCAARQNAVYFYQRGFFRAQARFSEDTHEKTVS